MAIHVCMHQWSESGTSVLKGYDCNPMLLTYNGSQGSLSLVSKLDIPQEKEAGAVRCAVLLFSLVLAACMSE